jgi:hypothetical protein
VKFRTLFFLFLLCCQYIPAEAEQIWNFSAINEITENSPCLKARSELQAFRYSSAFSALREEIFSEGFESLINTENANYFIVTPEKIKSISSSFPNSYPVFINNEYEREQKILATEEEARRKKLPPLSRLPHAYQLKPADKKIPPRRTSYLKALKTEGESTITYIFPDHLSIKEQFPNMQFISHEVKDETQRYSLTWKILFYRTTENCSQNQTAPTTRLPGRKKLHPPAHHFPYR